MQDAKNRAFTRSRLISVGGDYRLGNISQGILFINITGMGKSVRRSLHILNAAKRRT
jgi:hypothetical protein